ALHRNRGEEVKTLGDGVLAVFGSAADAAECAVAMQQAVQRQAAALQASLAIRIGIGLGDVRFEEGDVFGTPVVEAARLVEAARPGQILATAIVQVVAGGRAGGVRFDDIGLLQLKGFPELVPTCEVRWEALPPLVPLPALLSDKGSVFVAREEEMERLEQLWKEAAAGELRLALLAGEPGVGKTRLAAELAGRVHELGVTVLAGRCDEDLGVPYQPFVEALRHFVDHVPAEELAGRLGRYGGELVRLVPEAEGVPGLTPPLQSDPETERYRLFDAVAAWLAAASRDEPILLVLDDLQWSARPTLLLLRHLISRRTETTRVLVVGTYRDTELSHDHPLVEVLADLRRQEGVERFSLTGLDQSGVARFMERRLGHTLADDELPLARAIYQETEGNPFFVREVLRHLAESGTTGRPVEELGIPEGVREVVGRRLARLSRETNDVLRVASVVGTEFEVPVVQEAEHLDEEQLISALEEASRARLIIDAPGNRYRFAHSLVRHTLYESLSAARRVRLHTRVGEAIESVFALHLDDHMPALVHHWSRAAAPRAEAARAVGYALRAGDLAQAQLAHHEAAAYYRHGLELLEVGSGDDAQRAQLLVMLGEAQHRMGDPGYRATVLEGARLAERIGDAYGLARAALAGYRGMWTMSLGVDRERVAALEAALRAWEGHEDLVRARLLANLAVELMFVDRQRRWALSDEALAVARRLGDRPTLGRVLLSRIAAIWEPGALAERRAHVGELLVLAAELGDPFLKVWAELYGFETAMEVGEVDEADRLLAEAQRTAQEVERALRWFAEFPRAGRALFAGSVEEAVKLSREALEVGRATQPLNEFRIIYGVQRFEIRVEQDRVEEVLPALIEAAGSGIAESRAMLAQAYCELGRPDEAREVFDPLMAVLPGMPPDPNWIIAVVRSAAVCAELGDRGAAGRLHPLLTPYADRIAGNGVIWLGSVSHFLGVLATTLERFDDAERHLAAAEAVHDRLRAPGWLARTRLERARLLRRRGGPEDADKVRRLLDLVMASARELGLASLERRAAALR
ncbi:MAG TPA: AAA family ATPase, partial [Acidimicrobiia bacterium]|nr:AAA family ATPase [Acidimicrobiia bacterium]